MHRRTYLSAAIGVLTATAGCLGRSSASGPPTVSGDEPTVGPGQRVTLTAEATDATEFRFLPQVPEAYHESVSLVETDVSPTPSTQADSFPPIWYWDRPRDVTGELVVEVASDAPDGEFGYDVSVANEADRVRESFTVNVRVA
ncbi:hypothetical protein N0B31_18380 [Salinirubellus salinus]|jgi:hypothetical protein|uniref:Uncharacterized protein n=1 Tax=Salinirubellus salinus TaxID=1364945 RepID=A0A9E7R232_9EURY|nr:hypothetical protein [Salinirubellus salinus]UWM54073.1 hypothetical protein N0B31_18380 [Salinirubellus salinus]